MSIVIKKIEDVNTRTDLINRRKTKTIVSDSIDKENVISFDSAVKDFLDSTSLTDSEKEKLSEEWNAVNELKTKIKTNNSLVASVTNKINKELADFEFEFDISDQPILKKAVKKIFKKNLNKINYEMYLRAKEELAKIHLDKIKEVE